MGPDVKRRGILALYFGVRGGVYGGVLLVSSDAKSLLTMGHKAGGWVDGLVNVKLLVDKNEASLTGVGRCQAVAAAADRKLFKN
jgi:hypothetical protein